MTDKTKEKIPCMILQCTVKDTSLGKEMGSVGMAKGDVLVIRSDMGQRILTQYNPRFKHIGNELADELKSGFYEVRPVQVEQPREDKPKEEKKQGQTRVGMPNDRSLGPVKRKGR
jgi:ABC-type sulfate transport system substrate-binding protein